MKLFDILNEMSESKINEGIIFDRIRDTGGNIDESSVNSKVTSLLRSDMEKWDFYDSIKMGGGISSLSYEDIYPGVNVNIDLDDDYEVTGMSLAIGNDGVYEDVVVLPSVKRAVRKYFNEKER